jgi:hypothetical protein
VKPQGPVLTLLAGAVTAAVLFGLSVNASTEETDRRDTAAEATPSIPIPTSPPASAPPSAAPDPAASPAPTVPGRPADTTPATYAGRVSGSPATVAIVLKDGRAVAYVCDGRRTEAWLRGSVVAGRLTLTGLAGARLDGNHDGASATGTVTVLGQRWPFRVAVAKPPSGLYRAAATISGARVVAGWIVLADGTQVGILTRADSPAPAPRLDPKTGVASVDGTPLTAAPVDATGF